MLRHHIICFALMYVLMHSVEQKLHVMTAAQKIGAPDLLLLCR